MSSKKLYIVDTIVSYRMRYAVEAECLEHAYDEVVMNGVGPSEEFFEEVTQRYLGENIIDGREIKKEEFLPMLDTLSKTPGESCSSWMGEKLIRKIDYQRETE